MRNLMRIGLVTLAAFALVTVAFACDAHKAEQTAAAGDSLGKTEPAAGGCAHAEKANGKAGCAHAEKANGKAGCGDKAEGKAGCTHAAKAEGKDMAGGCPFHSEATEAQKAALVKGEKVTLVGHVVCASCDLKQAKDCRSIFKTDSGSMYAIIGNDAFEKLAGETKHGEKKVEITGTTAKDSGESILLLQTFKLVS